MGKNTAARFAVGRPGECSSVFRVWANRRKFDVYASIRTWNGFAKFSFHESGTYIYHLASLDHENTKWVDLPDPNSKRIRTWERPAPFVPGWTHLVTFMVPTEDVRSNPTSGFEDPEKVRWIAKPDRVDTITEFRVAVGDPNRILIDAGPPDFLLDAGIVDGFVLSNDQIVVITMHVTALDPVRRRDLKEFRRRCVADIPDDFSLEEKLGPRIAVGSTEWDGRVSLWDLMPPADMIIRGQQTTTSG
ncbi:hypothetical protein [Nocardia farcinica]|uniref:hypothetical protein n=1 Tax=Nocardia farcinica TaxID=37329 RepID=UPI002457C33D|nr:hypothetical protein [Nocardia farcinica]